MKRFLGFACAAALAFTLTTEAFSQGGAQRAGAGGGQSATRQGGQQGPGRAMMGRNQQEILAKLNLSADQKKKIEALNKKLQSQMEALRPKQGQNVDRRQQMEKARPIFEKYQKDFQAILTPAQRKKHEQLVAEAREKARKEREKRGAANGGRAGAGGGTKAGSGGGTKAGSGGKGG